MHLRRCGPHHRVNCQAFTGMFKSEEFAIWMDERAVRMTTSLSIACVPASSMRIFTSTQIFHKTFKAPELMRRWQANQSLWLAPKIPASRLAVA
jgi:hypothetical protein